MSWTVRLRYPAPFDHRFAPGALDGMIGKPMGCQLIDVTTGKHLDGTVAAAEIVDDGATAVLTIELAMPPGQPVSLFPGGTVDGPRCERREVWWPDDEGIEVACYLAAGHKPADMHWDNVMGRYEEDG